MRKIFGIIGLCLLAAVGCKHIGGKCDCGPTPGDGQTYAPYTSAVRAPVVVDTPAVAVPVAPKEMPLRK
jgi:hypothetical protein